MIPFSQHKRSARNLCFAALLFSSVGCNLGRNSENNNGMRERFLSALSRGNGQTASFQNSAGLKFRRIPAGEFQMGSENVESFAPYSLCEGPQHRVKISRDFWLAQHEVTVGQFRKFVEATDYITEAEQDGLGCNGLNPVSGDVEQRPHWTWRNPGYAQESDHPVVCVSWNDAMRFCEWLSASDGKTYRLPTEAEWEYACRAGSTGPFNSGSDRLRGYANAADKSLKRAVDTAQGISKHSDGHAFTAPVGQFKPNAWGLYDMHGNAGEWCADWFAADAYARHSYADPTGPADAQPWRVVRGGSWYNTSASCRSACRHDGQPTKRSTTNGFRVACDAT